MTAHTRNQELVFRAALLAGMGRQAQAIAADLPAAPSGGQGKTCIDGGGMMLFALHSARPAELGIIRRIPGDTAPGQPWLRTHYHWTPAGIQADDWQSYILSGEGQAQFAHVLRVARAADTEQGFRSVQAELGHRGRFIFTMQAQTAACSPAWIGWQLDRDNPPAAALKALGWGALWPQARQMMEDFLGMPLTERSRPWSIAIRFEAGCAVHDAPVRIGSTIWARQPEERAKHRRLARGIERLGGDGRMAEALYKLLLPATIEPGTRVGRSIEVEFRDGELQGASVLLAGLA